MVITHILHAIITMLANGVAPQITFHNYATTIREDLLRQAYGKLASNVVGQATQLPIVMPIAKEDGDLEVEEEEEEAEDGEEEEEDRQSTASTMTNEE